MFAATPVTPAVPAPASN